MCDIEVTITRQSLEPRVLSGLRQRMLTPDLVAEFVREFEPETVRLSKSAANRHSAAATRLAEVERRIAGLVDSIENGAWIKALGQRLDDLEREQASLEASNLPALVLLVRSIAAELYRERVAALEAPLSEPSIRNETAGFMI